MDAPELRTDRLSTRSWRADDVDWYLAARDAEVFRFTREVDLDPASWEEGRLRSLADADRMSAAVVAAGDDLPIGAVGVERRAGTVALSYWIDADHRGQGFATEVVRAITPWIAEALVPERIELEIHPENAASIAVAERSGYRDLGMRSSCDSCADASGRIAVYGMDV